MVSGSWFTMKLKGRRYSATSTPATSTEFTCISTAPLCSSRLNGDVPLSLFSNSRLVALPKKEMLSPEASSYWRGRQQSSTAELQSALR